MWWQILIIIICFCLAGALLGLFIGYIILRKQNRQWPYPWPFKKNKTSMASDTDLETVRLQIESTEVSQEAVSAYFDSEPEDIIKQADNIVITESGPPEITDFRKEIETNLAITKAPWTGKLASFQTKVLDSDRVLIESFPLDLQENIREAYTDMRLANTLVWLSMDVGHRSKDLDESYLKLSNKIAERLQRAITILNNTAV